MGVSPLVRDARPGDAERVAELVAQLGYALDPADFASRLELMAAADNRVLIAEVDGQVVGCLTTATMQVIHRPAKVGRISMMVVEEGLRGTGIGRALVQEAEAILRAQGCYMVEVTSRFALEAAHAFYEALGYEKTSVRLARDL